MDADVLKRLESLENGLGELRDLYLSIKIEFMEIRKSQGKQMTGSPASASSPEEIKFLKDQMDSMQKSLIKLQDNHRIPATQPSIPQSQSAGAQKAPVDGSINEVIEQNKANIEKIISDIETLKKSSPSAARSSDIERLYREINSLKARPHDSGSHESRVKYLEDMMKREITSIKSDMASKRDVEQFKEKLNVIEEEFVRADEIDRMEERMDKRIEKLIDYQKNIIDDTDLLTKKDYTRSDDFNRLKDDKVNRQEEPKVKSKIYKDTEFDEKVDRLKRILDTI